MRIGATSKKDAAYCNQTFERVTKAAAAVTPNGPDDVIIISAKASDHAFQTAQCLSRVGDCSGAWAMYMKSKVGGSASTESFKTTVPHCSAFSPPTSGPLADPNAVRIAGKAALTSASQKMFKRDGTCLADLDTSDKALPDPPHRSTSPTSSLSQTRAICLMLAKRCDEGERLQRAALAQRKVKPQIADLNVKSLRQEWCK
jgi:hypothetical protein